MSSRSVSIKSKCTHALSSGASLRSTEPSNTRRVLSTKYVTVSGDFCWESSECRASECSGLVRVWGSGLGAQAPSSTTTQARRVHPTDQTSMDLVYSDASRTTSKLWAVRDSMKAEIRKSFHTPDIWQWHRGCKPGGFAIWRLLFKTTSSAGYRC